MEKHLYYNMAQISGCFNFAWSRWNLQAGRRKIVLQMRPFAPDKGNKQVRFRVFAATGTCIGGCRRTTRCCW